MERVQRAKVSSVVWPTLSSKRSYHKAKLVFLCLNSFVTSYFLSYLIRFSNIHNYNTRQSIRLSLPKVKLDCGKRTFLFSGAKIFNELPLNIANAENVQTSCRRARHFFPIVIFISVFFYYFIIFLGFWKTVLNAIIVFLGFLSEITNS